MGRHWSGSEIAPACKAYAKATLNPLVGADRDIDSFSREILTHMVDFSPADAADGTFQHRGLRVYQYLRDNVFNSFHKFNKCLRHIYVCNPTGVTEQQKINMAAAVFNRKVKGLDYAFKDYNAASHWKMYQGWVAVRHLPKFSFNNNSPPKCMVSSGSTETEEGWSSGVEFVETRMPARGVKRGRDAAKDKEKVDVASKRREVARDAQLLKMSEGMSEISAALKHQNGVATIVEALKVVTDPEQKKKLEEKLVAMALDLK